MSKYFSEKEQQKSQYFMLAHVFQSNVYIPNAFIGANHGDRVNVCSIALPGSYNKFVN